VSFVEVCLCDSGILDLESNPTPMNPTRILVVLRAIPIYWYDEKIRCCGASGAFELEIDVSYMNLRS
jgi:hypothetical protein